MFRIHSDSYASGRLDLQVFIPWALETLLISWCWMPSSEFNHTERAANTVSKAMSSYSV